MLLLALGQSAVAEILNNSTPFIRIRLGDNGRGSTNTVIYNPGIPTDMGMLAGITPQDDAVSTTAIGGGSGVFRVRVVTDLNARSGVGRVEGRFSYDSSRPMICQTAATCGTTQINFDRISWRVRDNDTHALVTQYNNSADQLIQFQRDTNVAQNRENTRHRNYFQYVFDNEELLPAGTYQGTITINGVGRF